MYEMACEIAGGLKYFMVFQLGSKPIVFHLEFHEIKLRGKWWSRQSRGDEFRPIGWSVAVCYILQCTVRVYMCMY